MLKCSPNFHSEVQCPLLSPPSRATVNIELPSPPRGKQLPYPACLWQPWFRHLLAQKNTPFPKTPAPLYLPLQPAFNQREASQIMSRQRHTPLWLCSLANCIDSFISLTSSGYTIPESGVPSLEANLVTILSTLTPAPVSPLHDMSPASLPGTDSYLHPFCLQRWWLEKATWSKAVLEIYCLSWAKLLKMVQCHFSHWEVEIRAPPISRKLWRLMFNM